MANINTGVGSLGNYNSSTGAYGTAGLLQKAYDKALEFKLRSEPMLRSIADKKPGSLTNNSNQVIFQIHKDLDIEIDPLDESTDPDTLGLATPDYVSVLMKEYGNMVARTKALKMFSFTDVDPAIANIVAYNMIDSIDTLYANKLITGTNVLYGQGGATKPTTRNTVQAEDTLTAAEIRKTVAKLRTAKVAPRKGNLYWVGIHPEVSHDFRVATDAAAWRTPQNYQATDKLWAGEIGTFEGAYFVESPRMPVVVNSGSVAVYQTLVAGQQALAEAVAEEPHSVVAPVTDNFGRFHKVGWYGALGCEIYRQEALWRIESSSSIAG
jgi:N4-gp56 family major capsid protein